MKNLKTALIALAMVTSVASANCCVTSCCTVVKCVQETVKLVPYKVCKTICIPVKDSCGNITGYKNVTQYFTKYKEVVVKKTVDCCCCR